MHELEFEGYTIRIGTSQQENADIVESSNPDDFWVHVASGPSAHGVISNPDNSKVPTKVVKRVCCLIKSQSNKYKSINKLPFTVTRVKNLSETNTIATYIVGEHKTITI
jgi:predicted ribosome quality control (RQC) complex YloA/Tae2 family protein